MRWLSPLGMRGRCALAALCLSSALQAQNPPMFKDGFEPPNLGPATTTEAARFLNRATFGATRAEVDQLVGIGYSTWLSNQVNATPTLSRSLLEEITIAENIAGRSLSASHRIQRWLDVAVSAPDQLRQRMAWALSQIIVVSDQDSTLSQEPIMMAAWNDILVRNALGNYRSLLGEVARSPMMARYLSHLRNRKYELTPRCKHRTNSADTTLYTCTSSQATANNTQPPIIVAYQLPTSGLVAPDENFAREVMQLFSIGLIERNADFSPIQGGNGPVPTYDQRMISDLARVLTGLSYNCSGNRNVAGQTISRTCSCSGSDCSFSTSAFSSTPPSLTLNNQSGLVHPDRYEPLICYPRYHDSGRDRTGFALPGPSGAAPAGAQLQLNAGQTIPGGAPEAFKSLTLGGAELLRLREVAPGLAPGAAPNCDSLTASSDAQSKSTCLNYCNSSLDSALDTLFLHPNTATMVARQLIQRFTDSNPSPAYIARVAAVFANNGSGVRGDLAAVIRAVLLDAEALQAPSPTAASAGKPREPLLKLIQLWRSIGATSPDTRADGYRRWARFANGCSSFSWPQCAYQMRPLGANTVFNFYSPDYQQPGAIAEAGLFSPELQIINENTAVLSANDLYGQICNGWGSSNNCHAALRATPPTDSAYFANSVLDRLPGGSCGINCSGADDAALIRELNLLLFGGQMSGAIGDPNQANAASNTDMHGVLFRLLRNGLTGSFGETDAQNARRREILYLLHLIAISPEFAAQR